MLWLPINIKIFRFGQFGIIGIIIVTSNAL